MTLTASGYARISKRLSRDMRNDVGKQVRAAARRAEYIRVAKTVITKEVDGVKTYELPEEPKIVEPPTPPVLSWLGVKSHPQHNPGKGRSGYSPEHQNALVENASRIFTAEVLKALLPVVSIEPATVPAPEISEVLGA